MRGYGPAGRIPLERRESREAVGRLQAAVAANPTLAEAQDALGRADAGEERLRRGEPCLQRNAAVNPARSPRGRAGPARAGWRRPDRSIQFAEQAPRSRPQSDAQLTLVRGLIARKEVRRAEGELEALKQQNPTILPSRRRRAFSRHKGDRAGAGRALYARSSSTRTISRRSERCHARLVAEGHGKRHPMRRGPVARRRTTRARCSAGEYLPCHWRRETDGAETAQDDRGGLSNVQGYELLGCLNLSQQRLDEALAEFDGLARLIPGRCRRRRSRGHPLGEEDAGPGAKQYEQARRSFPRSRRGQNLGWRYVQSDGSLDVALQLAQAATRRLPDSAAMQDTLGSIDDKKGTGRARRPAVRAKRQTGPEEPDFPLPPGAGGPEGGRLGASARLPPGGPGALAGLRGSDRGPPGARLTEGLIGPRIWVSSNTRALRRPERR